VDIWPLPDLDMRSERARAVVHFSPAERREVDALADSRLLMLLAPRPGPGHAGN